MKKDFLSSRELSWNLAMRDINTRFRQTKFGILWAFFPALLMAFSFIFLQHQGIISVNTDGVPYPVFVMTGTVLWQLFSDSINAPLRAMNGARSFLTKINFPREALLLSALIQIIFDHLIRCTFLAIALLVFKIPLTVGIALGILGMFFIMILGFSVGLLLVPVGMLYTDVSHSLSGALGLLFFITPVFYSAPKKWPYSFLANFNPISSLLTGTRELLLKGSFLNPVSFFVVAFFSLFLIIIGWIAFRISLPVITERLGT